ERAAEDKLTSRVHYELRQLDQPWARTAALLELAADRDKITPTTYRHEWASPEIRTPEQAADAGQKLHAMGVPLASILSETMGWTPEQVTTALARRRDDLVDRAAAGLSVMGRAGQ